MAAASSAACAFLRFSSSVFLVLASGAVSSASSASSTALAASTNFLHAVRKAARPAPKFLELSSPPATVAPLLTQISKPGRPTKGTAAQSPRPLLFAFRR